jgi:hypothetical protein
MQGGKLDSIMSEYNEKMKPVVNTAEADLVDADLIDENLIEE